MGLRCTDAKICKGVYDLLSTYINTTMFQVCMPNERSPNHMTEKQVTQRLANCWINGSFKPHSAGVMRCYTYNCAL
jgi:hypothetical protein